jgi:hypothetical protein
MSFPGSGRSGSRPRAGHPGNVHHPQLHRGDIDQVVDELTTGVPIRRYDGFETDDKGIYPPP